MDKRKGVSGCKRKVTTFFLLLATWFLLPGALSTALAADAPYSIIHPSDEEHRLLPKTCTVCHKEDQYFFIVSGKNAAELDKAMQKLTGVVSTPKPATAEGVPPELANPHTTTSCYFCHATQPEEGSKGADLQYRSVTGGFVPLAQTDETCQLCHPDINSKHKRVLSSSEKAQKGLARAGLPTPDKKILCITCHDMHKEGAIEFSLRIGFFEFARTSLDVFPHGQNASCLACHPKKPSPTERVSFIGEDKTELCTRCHGSDHPSHVVGKIGSVETYPMDFLGFPLGKDDELDCSTCHDEPCQIDVDLKANTTMLRGGPYYRMTNFCEKCHPTAGPGKVNPHIQIGAKGEKMEGSCAFCHITDPSKGEFGPGDMNYIESRNELCTLCHEVKPHPSVPHLGIEVGGKRLKSLRRYEDRHEVLLPLDEDNRMECNTCHNSHDKGVLTGMKALGAGELKQLRIPSFAELCTPCHARYD